MATGRIAILLFFGWAFKFLAGLHRAHAEQAVIYRDRKAALGVAEPLLNATPEIEQKREMLKTLTTVYLDFERSAFTEKRASTAQSDANIDAQIKHVKDAVEAIRPLLDVANKAAEKATEKPKA